MAGSALSIASPRQEFRSLWKTSEFWGQRTAWHGVAVRKNGSRWLWGESPGYIEGASTNVLVTNAVTVEVFRAM